MLECNLEVFLVLLAYASKVRVYLCMTQESVRTCSSSRPIVYLYRLQPYVSVGCSEPENIHSCHRTHGVFYISH